MATAKPASASATGLPPASRRARAAAAPRPETLNSALIIDKIRDVFAAIVIVIGSPLFYLSCPILKTARSTSDDDCKHPGERRERTGTGRDRRKAPAGDGRSGDFRAIGAVLAAAD